MFTRSDWPETGLPRAIGDEGLSASGQPDWLAETSIDALRLRWVATTDAFESGLYHVPVTSVRIEIEAFDEATLAHLEGPVRDQFRRWVDRLVAAIPWPECYLLAKVVRGELLYDALTANGFDEVEQRSMYWTRVSQLIAPSPGSSDIVFATLADADPRTHDRYRDEMLDICAEGFEKGHSRHFRDPFLLARAPGLDYIRSVMRLNFEHVAPGFQLLAIDSVRDLLCGFSIVGAKRGLAAETFTQLLTGVRREYRGRGVYQGVTGMLKQMLPSDGVLVNATHSGNTAMEAAYRRSGRQHLADTVVLRRVFGSSGNQS
jgi:hypothetical protein